MSSSDDYKFSPHKPSLDNIELSDYETAYDAKERSHIALHFEEIEGHVERHIGPVQVVYHDLVSKDFPVDVMVVPATSDRRFHYLVTAGMSDHCMHLPARVEKPGHYRYAELVMALPSYWPVFDEKAMLSSRWGYPIDHLKFLASVPNRYRSWLAVGHSVPHKEPVEPLGPDCEMTGFVLDYPVIGGEDFCKFKARQNKTINFYGVYPVYPSEMSHKLKKGYASLRTKFSEHHVMELFDPKRAPVISHSWSRLLNW